MEESLSAQPDPRKKPVQNEPTKSRDEGTMFPTNYLVVLLVLFFSVYIWLRF